jgi:hypothetical protein
MPQTMPEANAIAQRLLAYDITQGTPAELPGQAVVRACEKLCGSLSRVVGVAGFRSILVRALTLARRDVPWLATVEVTGEGALAGFGEAARAQDPAVVATGGSALLTQFLGLLHLFIGEALTGRLLADGWPDTPFDPPSPGRQENAR